MTTKREGGVTWRVIATGIAAAAWLVLFGLMAWTLSAVVQLKVDVAQIKEHLGMQANTVQIIENKK